MPRMRHLRDQARPASLLNRHAMTLRASLPTGAVTFAFTDIEGSTARWERDRAAMQVALTNHVELPTGLLITKP